MPISDIWVFRRWSRVINGRRLMTNSATYAVKTNIVFSFGAKLSLNPNIIPKENSCQLIFPKSLQNSQRMKFGYQFRALTTAL